VGPWVLTTQALGPARGVPGSVLRLGTPDLGVPSSVARLGVPRPVPWGQQRLTPCRPLRTASGPRAWGAGFPQRLTGLTW